MVGGGADTPGTSGSWTLAGNGGTTPLGIPPGVARYSLVEQATDKLAQVDRESAAAERPANRNAWKFGDTTGEIQLELPALCVRKRLSRGWRSSSGNAASMVGQNGIQTVGLATSTWVVMCGAYLDDL